jgi:transcriptional regulator with XRE-family HTH domain
MDENIIALKSKTKDGFQHNGKMLAEYFESHSINKAALSRKMGMAPSTIQKYFESESLQFRILWKISVAIKHNFLAELTFQLPSEVVDQIKSARELELEEELEKVKFELSIYKNIVGK